MAVELTKQSILGVSKQVSTVGLHAHTTYPRTFEATGAGSAGGIDIVASTLATAASGNDDFVGMIVEVIKGAAASGGESGAPLRGKITGYSHATQTLTVEALGFATADGDTFKLLDRDTGYWGVSAGGSQTVITDTTRDEAADFWNGLAATGGPYMVAISASAITDETQRVINNSASAGTASCSSFGASTAVGDLFEAWQWPEIIGGVPGSFNQPRVDRPAMTGSLGMQRGVAGLRDGSISPELPFAGSGTAGEPNCWDPFLGSVCTVTADVADETIAASTTTTSINVSGAVALNGMWVSEGGDVMVATTAADPFTPSPSARIAPLTGETLYSMRTYTPATAVQYALALLQWEGTGLKTEAFGCVPNLSFSGERGQWLKMTAALQCADHYTTHLDETNAAYARTYVAKIPTVRPRAVPEIRINLDGTEIEGLSFTLDMGVQIQPKTNLSAANHTDGFDMTGYAVTGNVKVQLDSDAKAAIRAFRQGDPVTLLIQCGTTPGNPGVWAFWAYEVEYTGDARSDDAGRLTVDLPFRVTEDNTTTLSRWIMGIG